MSSPVTGYYHKKLQTLGGCIFKLGSNADLLSLWDKLLKTQIDDEAHGLMRSRILMDLYTQLYLARSMELRNYYHFH